MSRFVGAGLSRLGKGAVCAVVMAASAVVVTGAAPGTSAAAAPPALPCTGDPSQPAELELTVGGQPATGRYAVPDSTPKGLVVFFHGYTETSKSWEAHLTRVAAEDGVIAVAMDYRGITPGTPNGPFPRSKGMPLKAGAEDGVAAAKAFDAACPGLPRIVAYGNSLGGGIAGLATAAKAKRANGGPLFDRLIATAGFSNMIEGWTELTIGAQTGGTFFVQGKADLEQEMGGTPLTAPGAYVQRSSALRATDIAAAGVTGVTLVHGLADGTVPVDQSIEMALTLTAAGVPVDLILAGAAPAGTATGDTLDRTVLKALGMPPEGLPVAGHPDDTDSTHAVAAAGFAQLSAVFAGAPAPDCLRVSFVDAGSADDAISDGLCTTTSLLKKVLDPVSQVLTPILSGLLGLLK